MICVRVHLWMLLMFREGGGGYIDECVCVCVCGSARKPLNGARASGCRVCALGAGDVGLPSVPGGHTPLPVQHASFTPCYSHTTVPHGTPSAAFLPCARCWQWDVEQGPHGRGGPPAERYATRPTRTPHLRPHSIAYSRTHSLTHSLTGAHHNRDVCSDTGSAHGCSW